MANVENEKVIEKLMDHYKVYKLKELAIKMNVNYDSLSSWKRAATLNPLKNMCRGLGIYNEIFDNLIIPVVDNYEINAFDNKKHLDIKTISFENKELKRVINNWGVQGYGIAIGVILYLKENDTLDIKHIDSLSDDLKTTNHLVSKVIEDCNLFRIEYNNLIKLNLKEI